MRRFDANSYLVIGKAMDLAGIGRGRGGLEAVMSACRGASAHDRDSLGRALPDIPAEQIRDVLLSTWRSRDNCVEIDSEHGHDLFLIDLDQVGDAVSTFLDDMQKEHPQ